MKNFLFSNRKFFIFITVLLLSISFVANKNKAEAAEIENAHVVNTEEVNVYANPAEEDDEIITVLDKGVVVSVIEEMEDWSKIELPKADNTTSIDTEFNTGYVKSESLKEGTSLEEKKPEKKPSKKPAKKPSKKPSKKPAKKVVSKGQKVVDYAKRFVGNPYRWGGESLTRGADCSGFVKSVYKHFGKNLPHSSYSLRRVGKRVSSLSKAKAGDIVCYNGHVAIYMGKNKIVHASNVRTGIKISTNARYRSIVSIRRIFK